MAKQQSSVLERQRVDVSEPKRYKVYIHNDDFTPMDFVVKLLITVFYKNKDEAERLMLKVHRSDKVRVVRDGIVVHTGDILALKRFKDDVKSNAVG